MSRCIWITPQIPSSAFALIDPSSESSSVDYSSIDSKIDSYTTKSPSSNSENYIISLFCPWDDVLYVIYDTSGCVASASE